jgi:hypothetical protein
VFSLSGASPILDSSELSVQCDTSTRNDLAVQRTVDSGGPSFCRQAGMISWVGKEGLRRTTLFLFAFPGSWSLVPNGVMAGRVHIGPAATGGFLFA